MIVAWQTKIHGLKARATGGLLVSEGEDGV